MTTPEPVQVKRYTTTYTDHRMVETSHGEYVLHADYEALRRENEELKRDKARLDWLERNYFLHAKEWTSPVVYSDGNGIALHGDTLRNGIDAAMAQEKGKE